MSMKKMKIKYFGWCLVGVLALTCGCSDWLDVNPRTEIKEKDIYTNEASFKNVMNGIYIQLASRELYGVNMSCYFPDLLAQLWTPTTQSTASYITAYNFTHKDVEPVISAIWSKYYTALAHVNNLLENLSATQVTFTNGNKDLLLGEAYGLRAFIHLEVLRLFGPLPQEAQESVTAIPYTTKMTKDPAMLVSKTYGEVKRLILQDLDSAEVHLKNDPFALGNMYDFNHPGDVLSVYEPAEDWHYYRQTHFNSYAVDATRARFFQWTGDTERANTYAKKVLEVMNPDQTNKFTLTNEASYSDSRSANLVMQSEHIFAVNCSNHQELINGILVGSRSTLYSTKNNVNKMYENATDDIRNKAGRYWEFDGNSAFFLKYSGSGLIPSLNMIPLIRLSEMYLILIENLPIGEAASYFETYRQSRGMSVSVSISESNRNTRVETEYRKEFIGEGQMFFWYKRHNVTTYTFPSRFNVPANGYVIPKPKGQTAFE